MKCPVCQAEGLKSAVSPPGGGISTSMAGQQSYYDEEGFRHYHEIHWVTSAWKCSRGHRGSLSTLAGCPSADRCGNVQRQKIGVDLAEVTVVTIGDDGKVVEQPGTLTYSPE